MEERMWNEEFEYGLISMLMQVDTYIRFLDLKIPSLHRKNRTDVHFRPVISLAIK